MEKIIVTLWITFGIYLMVLLAIMADLWSGVRKANNIQPALYSDGNAFDSNTYAYKSQYPKSTFTGSVFIPYFKII